MLEQTRALHRATTQSREATYAAARRLHATIDGLLPTVAAFNFGPESLDVILASIEADAERGEYSDYAAAEQVAMAAQSVVVAFENDGRSEAKRHEQLRNRLDAPCTRRSRMRIHGRRRTPVRHWLRFAPLRPEPNESEQSSSRND